MAASAASSANSTAFAASWLASARPGFCATTNSEGDCERGDSGSFQGLDIQTIAVDRSIPRGGRGLASAAELCLERCLLCRRCHYISKSRPICPPPVFVLVPPPIQKSMRNVPIGRPTFDGRKRRWILGLTTS